MSASKLTKKDQKPIPEVRVISDPEVIKVLLNKTRREILQVMRKGYYRDGSNRISYDMSVGEIAEILETTPQRLYHHIDKLIEAGLVEKSREVKKVRSVITYYKRTARNFVIAYESDSTGEMYEEQGKSMAKTIKEAFDLKLTNDEFDRLSSIVTKLSRNSSFYYSKLAGKLSPDYQGKDVHWALDLLRRTFQVNDPEYIKQMNDLRGLLQPKLGFDTNVTQETN